jgi:hypothetical protein
MAPARSGHAQLLDDVQDDEVAEDATAGDAAEAGSEPAPREKPSAAAPGQPEGVRDDGLPWLQVLCLLAVTTSEGILSTMLFPFVPYMVADFGLPVDDVGYYAGLLGSAYNLAQVTRSTACALTGFVDCPR